MLLSSITLSGGRHTNQAKEGEKAGDDIWKCIVFDRHNDCLDHS